MSVWEIVTQENLGVTLTFSNWIESEYRETFY